MPKVVLSFKMPQAPVSTLMKRMEKGVEQFYYAGLFARSSDYDQSKLWTEWLERGFNIAIFSPPPSTRPEDAVHVSVRDVPSATPSVWLVGGNAEGIKNVQLTLEAIESVRTSLQGKDDEAKLAATQSTAVAQQLFQPVASALVSAGVSKEGQQAYAAMLQRGFLALTNDIIETVTIS